MSFRDPPAKPIDPYASITIPPLDQAIGVERDLALLKVKFVPILADPANRFGFPPGLRFEDIPSWTMRNGPGTAKKWTAQVPGWSESDNEDFALMYLGMERLRAEKAGERVTNDERFGVRDENYKFTSLAQMRRKRTSRFLFVLIPLLAVGILVIVLNIVPPPTESEQPKPQISQQDRPNPGIGAVIAVGIAIGGFFLVIALFAKSARSSLDTHKAIKKAEGFRRVTLEEEETARRRQATQAAEWARLNKSNSGLE